MPLKSEAIDIIREAVATARPLCPRWLAWPVWGIYIPLVSYLALLVLYTSLRTLFGSGMPDNGQ